MKYKKTKEKGHDEISNKSGRKKQKYSSSTLIYFAAKQDI
jgi:hypothetical protein